jgi:hypothetical protein
MSRRNGTFFRAIKIEIKTSEQQEEDAMMNDVRDER